MSLNFFKILNKTLENLKLYSVYLTLVIIISCDKIEPPFKEQVSNTIDTASNDFYPYKKVLLEKFTGHRCGFCPSSDEKVNELISMYNEKLIVVNYHSGFFAEPLPPTYIADYRTPEGDFLYNFFEVQNTPIGIVDRKKFDNSYLIEYQNWQNYINQQLSTNPDILINISSNILNDNVLQVRIILKLKKQLQKVKLAVLLVEDSIISPQKDYTKPTHDILDYVHKNVFRKYLTSPLGDDINLNNKLVNDTIIKVLSTNINQYWMIKNCYVCSFVLHPDSLFVLQSEIKKLNKNVLN